MKIPTTKCYLCGKPVERTNILRDDYNWHLVIEVFCHGNSERCRLDEMSLFTSEIVEAVAFQTKMLHQQR